MKIKTKVIISMVLLVLTPILLTYLVGDKVFISRNSKLYNNLTSEEFHQKKENSRKEIRDFIVGEVLSNPKQFDQKDVQNKLEGMMSNEYLGIVVVKNGSVVNYIGENQKGIRNSEFDLTFVHNNDVQVFENDEEGAVTISYEEVYNNNYDILDNIVFRYDDGEMGIVYIYINSKVFYLSNEEFTKITMIIFVVSLIATLLVVFLWLTMSIRKPLNKLMENIGEISIGQFQSPVFIERGNEFRELTRGVEHMRKSLNMHEANKRIAESEKKDLIANISHDIRTPLTAIKGYVQGIQDGVVKDDVTLKEYLSIISSKTDVIGELVDDLKFISKFDRNKVELDLQFFDLNDFLTDCIEDARYEFEDANVYLEYRNEIEDNRILADPQKMQRVLTNLTGNAIKYNKDRQLNIKIDAFVKENMYNIVFSDDGVGVSKDSYHQLFTRFFREDESRNSDIEGSGIGLSICKEIINAHKGEIQAYETKGGGLTIHIKLKKVG